MSTSTNGIGSAVLSSLGIGNFNVQTIAETLARADVAGQKSIYETKQSKLDSRLSSLNTLQQAFSALQVGVKELAKASTFNQLSVSSSDESTVRATRLAEPTAGVYEVEVLSRAQAHSLASVALPSQNAPVGMGTMNLSVGGVQANITINASNNSLAGLRDAIRASGLPVNASIVNDGAGHRLMLSSQQTGSANAIGISVIDGDGNHTDMSGLSRFINTNMTQTVAAQNASFKVNGLSMTSQSNQVDNVIDGVRLSLNRADVGSPKTITIATDNSKIAEKIQSFVDDYNAMDAILDNLGSYTKDPNDPTKGSLAGDSVIRNARSELKSILDFRLTSGSVQSLADIGIKSNRDGTISLDSARLNQAVAADSQAVARLFSAFGQPTDSQIKFVGASDRTVEGTFAVDITQAARQALYLGNTMAGLPTDSVTIDASNDNFSLTLNGTASTTLSLAHGSYSKTDLAAMLQTAINNDTNLKARGFSVSVAFDSTNNRLQVNTNGYGSAMSINFTSVDSNMGSTLGLTTGSGATGSHVGQDVAGSLISSGLVNYTFSGTGQRVKINSLLAGSPRDLEFDVLGSATGSRGNIDFTNGVAAKLNKQINDMQKTDNGLLGQPISVIQSQKNKITERLSKIDERYQVLLKRYTTQFSEANAIQSQMKNLSASLMAQFNRPSSSN